ncbi:MAG: hypothetical protein GWP08_13690 [Nitrospiraceae bacterium]|nr:hypothetical protein [Nitrospiraceae bacterium]
MGEKTIPYESQEDVKALVNGFLAKCLDQFGPRGLTIMDSCEADTTNVYNGLVRPEQFKRNAFMYSVLGMAGECGMVFPPFRFRYLNETMGKARDAGLEEATLFLMYSATNFPSVYTFGDVLYEGGFDWRAGIGRYAATVAKDAESRADLVKLLAALEEMFTAANFDDKDAQLREAEAAWERLAQAPELYVDKD